MKITGLALWKGVGWTAGGYAVGQLFRLVTSITLAQLLAPEIFGIMVIVNSVRTGVDIMLDVGIGRKHCSQ